MAAKMIFPLSPEILESRRLLGNADNLHGKMDVVQAKTDNLPSDTASVLSAIQGATFESSTDSLEAVRNRVDALVGTPVADISTDIAGVKTVVDSNASALANETYGLSALKTVVSGIQTDLDNGTDGLGALKTLIDGNNTLLVSETYGLSAIKTSVAGVQSDLDNATDGLGAIKTAVDSNNTLLVSETYGLSAIKTAVAGVQTDLDNGTDGLGALKTLIDSVQSTVTAIQNNTRLTTSIAAELQNPGTGSVYHKFFVNLYDASGNKEDPDSEDLAVIITTPAGSDITTSRAYADASGTALADSTEFAGNKKLVKDSTGRYSFFYKSSSADTIETLNVQLRYNEGAVENNADRSLRVVEVLGDSSATKANQLLIMGDGFSSSTDSLKVLSDNLDLMMGATFSSGTDSLEAISDALAVVDGVVDGIAAEIGDMSDILGGGNATLADVLTDLGGATFSTSTDSNEAIRDRIDALVGTPVSSVSADIAAIQTKLGTPADTDVSTDIASVQSDTTAIISTLGTPAGASVSADIAEIQSTLDAMSALPKTFGAVVSTAAIAQGASEVVQFTTGQGVITNNSKLAQLKIAVTGASSNFKVQVFEKTGAPADNLRFEVQECDSTGINLDLNYLIFRNADVTPTNVIYVKITNVADASTSTFAVELRGELAN